MARLSLTLLGAFQASLDGESITTFESNKVRGLLAYLAAEAARPQRREALAALLWPDWPQASALRNLSYSLADLRKNLGDKEAKPPFLLISRDTLQLNPESDLQVDLWEFTRLVDTAPQISDPQSRIDALKSANDLYDGVFLEGFSLPDSVAFEEWLAARREHLTQQVMQVLHTLAEYHAGREEFELALPYAKMQVELAPWQEEAHQQVMRLLALSGQRGSALTQYETCRRVLKEQLDVEPGPETVKLYASIRDGTFGIQEKEVEEQPPAPGVAPFKGLQCFDVGDARLFFGREALTKQLVNHIWEMVAYRGAGDEVGGCCFLVVVGASGSGKSSLVRAGLVAALQHSSTLPERYQGWPVHIITPTAHPLEALAGSLTRGSESVTAMATLVDDMQRDTRSLHYYVTRLLGQSTLNGKPPEYLLLVIDQLEELFTLVRSEEESAAFIDNLLSASHGPALVVVTLRADFYAHCARYPGLRQALCTRQEYIGPMTADGLRRAIEDPARQGGWEFEAGLVDLILRDVGDEPGALPLLEHALLETWQRRSGRTMTLKGYAAAGGVKGAIAHTADAVYGRLTTEQQALARRIFLRLTELGEGTQDTRRRAALSELMPDTEEGAAVKCLLKTLADARLITLSEDSAEVAHEALIREWPALRAWLSEDRESLRLHRRLTEAAQGWEKMSRDPGELYRGARLFQAMEWAAQPGHASELNALEQEFLGASQAQAEKEEREREAQRQHELKAAQAMAESAQKLTESERKNAETQRHAAQRLRRRAWYLTGTTGLAAILMVAAVLIAITADHNARQATARQYASAALADLEIDTGQSISQALQSLQVEPSVEAYSALHQALFANHLRNRIMAHKGKVYGIAASPDGTRLATIGTDRILKVWRVNGATIEQPPLLTVPNVGLDDVQLNSTAGSFNFNPLQFSPDGKYLATVNSNEILLLDAFSGELVGRVNEMVGDIHTMAFIPNSSDLQGIWLMICAGSYQRMTGEYSSALIAEFEGGSGSIIGALNLHDGGGLSFAFRPDGKLVSGGWAVGDNNGQIKLWNPLTQSNIFELKTTLLAPILLAEKPGNRVYNLALSPDGNQVAYTTASDAYILDLTPLASGAPPVERATFSLDSDLTDIFYLKGGNRLASADSQGRTAIWDAKTGQLLFKLINPENGLIAIVASPIGQVLFTAHENGEICAWDVAAPGVPEWLTMPRDTTSGQPIQEFTLSGGAVCHPALTSDNRFKATCGDNNTALVWEVPSNKLVRSIQLPATSEGVQFSPDVRYLVVSLSSSQTAVFDFASGRELVVLPGSSGVVISYFGGYQFAPEYQFSPDSRYIFTTFPGDQTAYGFVLDNTELVRLACQQLAAITLPDENGVIPQLSICSASALNP